MTLPRLSRILDLLTRCLDLTRCRRLRKTKTPAGNVVLDRCIRSAWHRIWPRDSHRYRRREVAK